jgi:hypothetical protein
MISSITADSAEQSSGRPDRPRAARRRHGSCIRYRQRPIEPFVIPSLAQQPVAQQPVAQQPDLATGTHRCVVELLGIRTFTAFRRQLPAPERRRRGPRRTRRRHRRCVSGRERRGDQSNADRRRRRLERWNRRQSGELERRRRRDGLRRKCGRWERGAGRQFWTRRSHGTRRSHRTGRRHRTRRFRRFHAGRRGTGWLLARRYERPSERWWRLGGPARFGSGKAGNGLVPTNRQ